MLIGSADYFSSVGRYRDDLWKNLRSIHVFNRKVDYQTPFRKDGIFCTGAMTTAWFLWDMTYSGATSWEVLDVQQHANLGCYKRFRTKQSEARYLDKGDPGGNVATLATKAAPALPRRDEDRPRAEGQQSTVTSLWRMVERLQEPASTWGEVERLLRAKEKRAA